MSELLDQYCKQYFGHKDWEMDFKDGDVIVTFHRNPRLEYVQHLEQLEEGEDD